MELLILFLVIMGVGFTLALLGIKNLEEARSGADIFIGIGQCIVAGVCAIVGINVLP